MSVPRIKAIFPAKLLVILLMWMAIGTLHAQDTTGIKLPAKAGDTVKLINTPDTLTGSGIYFPLKSKDSVKIVMPAKTLPENPKPHSAHKATLFSLALPGLGQAYNHKYWKIPVIYAGFAATGYFAFTNQSYYLKYREAYNYTLAGRQDPIDNEYVGRYTLDQLKSQRDLYRRNMEFSFILGGFVYILNLVDAAVDAHLYNYDISDDITLRLSPGIIPVNNLPAGGGMTLTLNF
jgi:hypothetical protein